MTIRALADPRSTAADFVQPGHVSPLLAKEGGVLRRAGHTEATVDLLRMAGMKPVGVLIEVCSQRHLGMANMAELQELAAEYQIPIMSIEELIRYRRGREQLIHREVEVPLETKHYGKPTVIAYSVAHEDQEPLALVWGDLQAPSDRRWSACTLPASRATCSDRSAATVATSCRWRWR